MIKKQNITAFLLVATMVFASCSDKSGEKENPNGSDKLDNTFLNRVKTTNAVLSNQNQELNLTGKVEYDPDKVINYVALVNGIAERSYFSLGDKVQKGQTLLDIKSSDLSSLQSEAIGAESEVKISERELQTAQAMFEDNLLSEKELMEAQAKLSQAQAAYKKIQNDISLNGVNKGNGTFSIKSPMTGYIVNKNVSSGSTISTEGDPLFTVADLSKVWITANVYANNLQFVKEGMDVDITSFSYPGEVFHGKISSLSQVFDPEEKVLKARVVMDNKDMKLKPEMSVVVKLKNDTQAPFIAIPTNAVIFDDNKYFAIVQKNDNDFEVKEIVLQGHNNKTTYVASGLSEGDKVVTNNQLLIYSGIKDN